MASSNSQHTSRGINSNVNTVGPHVSQSCASNSNCGNSILRGYRPSTDGDEHLANNVMQPLQGKYSNMYNDYANNNVFHNLTNRTPTNMCNSATAQQLRLTTTDAQWKE